MAWHRRYRPTATQTRSHLQRTHEAVSLSAQAGKLVGTEYDEANVAWALRLMGFRRLPSSKQARKRSAMTAHQPVGSTKVRAESVQTYARIAGVLFLLTFVIGGFGEAYAPAQLIVSGNATATAHNVIASAQLLRLGFLGYLFEAFTDVMLAFLLYVLLRPAHANLAFLAVLFRLMATATFAFAEVFYFAPALILGGDAYLKTFSSGQLNTLALLSFNVYSFAGGFSSVFYGIASIILGYLMFRSGYLPRVLGALWMLGGVCFVASSLAMVVAPALASPLLLVPQLLAGLALAVWLLVRGVDVVKWNERGAAVTHGSVPSDPRQSPAL
jgi:Domain of unknown function (DUF4386)